MNIYCVNKKIWSKNWSSIDFSFHYLHNHIYKKIHICILWTSAVFYSYWYNPELQECCTCETKSLKISHGSLKKHGWWLVWWQNWPNWSMDYHYLPVSSQVHKYTPRVVTDKSVEFGPNCSHNIHRIQFIRHYHPLSFAQRQEVMRKFSA